MHVERMAKSWRGEEKSIGGMAGANPRESETQPCGAPNDLKTESAGLNGLRKQQIPEG